MKTIILPGFSLKNKDWAYELKDNINANIVVHEWKHWKTESTNLALATEIKTILDLTNNKTVNIIAKSIGTKVLIELLSKKLIKVNKIIMCGIPLKIYGKQMKTKFKKTLTDVNNILVIQNENDPLGKFEDVKKFIKDINLKIKVISKPRSDHNYPHYNDFEDFLK